MKKLFAFIISLTIVISPIAPLSIVSAGGLVPDCNKGELVLKVDEKGEPLKKLDKDGKPLIGKDGKAVLTGERVYKNTCDFDTLMELINRIINFLLFVLATPLVAIILCYAGFLLITSGGSSESRTKAKKMIKNVVIGYILALAAWLIVHTILNSLGVNKCVTFLGERDPACDVTKL